MSATVVGCDDGRPDRTLASDAATTANDETAFPTAILVDEPEANPADETPFAHLDMGGAGGAGESPVVADPNAPARGPHAPSGLAHPLLDRVVLIGASLTQGFGATLPVSDPTTPAAPPTFVPIALGDALVASIDGEFTPAVAQGDLFFFMRPDRAGERLATMAKSREPSLLVALDFLFWFGYGQLAPGETRDARLRRGFALLEPFDCPIVVADFPDLSEAVGRMISAAQMPTMEELETLNRMLREWAAARGDVRILPLADMLETLRNGEAVTIAGATWDGAAAQGLLQEDRMHGTPAGMLVVVRQLLHEIVSLEPAIGEVSAIAHDPDQARLRLKQAAINRVRPAE